MDKNTNTTQSGIEIRSIDIPAYPTNDSDYPSPSKYGDGYIKYCVVDGDRLTKHYLFKEKMDAEIFFNYITHPTRSLYRYAQVSALINRIKELSSIIQVKVQSSADHYRNLPKDFKNDDGVLYVIPIPKTGHILLNSIIKALNEIRKSQAQFRMKEYTELKKNFDEYKNDDGSAQSFHNRL